MHRTYVRIALWLLSIPAVLSLVYADGLLYPYVTLKTLLLRAAGVGVVAFIAYLIIQNQALYWERLRNKATWLPAALLAVAYTTSLFGLDFYHSFWSTFERGDGLLTTTFVVAFFYATLLCADVSLMRRLFAVVASVAAVLSIYTILQWIQTATGMNIPIIEIPRGRYGATFGNAAYLASYLGLTLFLTIAYVYPHIGQVRVGRWITFLYVSVPLQVFAIFLTATRGTLLAMVVTGFVALSYLSWRGVPGMEAGARIRTYARYLFIAGLLASVLFFIFREPLREVPIESVRRVASISLSEGTVSSRFFVWKHVLSETMRTAPMIGYGAEHVDAVFDKIYDPSALLEEWFDRAHNSFLDYLVQYGIVGALLYAALVAMFLYRSAGLFRSGKSEGALFFLLGLAYAVQNFFVFDIALTFWLFLLVFASMYVAEEGAKPLKRMPAIPGLVASVVAVAILGLIIPVSIQPLRANRALANGYLYHMADVDRSVTYMQKGLDMNTYADLEYGYNLYQMYTERQMLALEGGERLTAYQFARSVLSANFARYPYDARTAMYYAHILDVAPSEELVDETRLFDVVNTAIELSPKRMQPWYLLANISIRRGDLLPQGSAEKRAHYLEGIRILDEYAASVPNLAEPRFVIATLYLTIGEVNVAKEWAADALPLYKVDYNVAKRASRFYLLVEDYDNARRFLIDAVATSPTPDYALKYDLAKASFLSGRVEDAITIVNQLRVEAPGLVETDPAFLQALQAGQ